MIACSTFVESAGNGLAFTTEWTVTCRSLDSWCRFWTRGWLNETRNSSQRSASSKPGLALFFWKAASLLADDGRCSLFLEATVRNNWLDDSSVPGCSDTWTSMDFHRLTHLHFLTYLTCCESSTSFSGAAFAAASGTASTSASSFSFPFQPGFKSGFASS